MKMCRCALVPSVWFRLCTEVSLLNRAVNFSKLGNLGRLVTASSWRTLERSESLGHEQRYKDAHSYTHTRAHTHGGGQGKRGGWREKDKRESERERSTNIYSLSIFARLISCWTNTPKARDSWCLKLYHCAEQIWKLLNDTCYLYLFSILLKPHLKIFLYWKDHCFFTYDLIRNLRIELWKQLIQTSHI